MTDWEALEGRRSDAASPEETARRYIEENGEFVFGEEAKAALTRRRSFWGGAIVLVAIAGVAGFLVLSVGKGGPGGRDALPTNTHLGVSTTVVSAECMSISVNSSKDKLRVQPAQELLPRTLYNAKVATTDGTFTAILFTGTTRAAANDFVFLARRGAFHCQALTPSGSIGIEFGGDVDPPGAGSDGADPGQPIPAGSLVTPLGATSTTGARKWLVVGAPGGVSEPSRFVIFGRILSGLDVVRKMSAAARSGGTKIAIISVSIRTLS